MKQNRLAGSGVTNAPHVHNGTFTVSKPNAGHFTLKLFTVKKGQLKGKRIIALLVGPNNEKDFKAVAFWDDARQVVRVWLRFHGQHSNGSIDGYNFQETGWSVTESKLAIWADLAIRGATKERHGYWFGEGYTLLLASHCVRCNRKLTDPKSIALGIGPECATK